MHSQGLLTFKDKQDLYKERTKNFPKKPMCAFLHFLEDQRKQFQTDNPHLNNSQLSKLIGLKWNNMSDEDRKQYEDLRERDKERYDTQMKEFN